MTENWLLFSLAALLTLAYIVRQALAYRKALKTPPRKMSATEVAKAMKEAVK